MQAATKTVTVAALSRQGSSEPRRVLLRPFRRRHGGSGRDGKGRDFRLRSAGTAPRPDAVRIVVASLDVAMELSERPDRF